MFGYRIGVARHTTMHILFLVRNESSFSSMTNSGGFWRKYPFLNKNTWVYCIFFLLLLSKNKWLPKQFIGIKKSWIKAKHLKLKVPTFIYEFCVSITEFKKAFLWNLVLRGSICSLKNSSCNHSMFSLQDILGIVCPFTKLCNFRKWYKNPNDIIFIFSINFYLLLVILFIYFINVI